MIDFTKFKDNLDLTSNALHVLGILKKKVLGTEERYALNGDTLRRHFPAWTKSEKHESRWTYLLGQLEARNRGMRTAILMHFMPLLHEQQQADLVQSAADACRIGDEDAEKRVLEHLWHIVSINRVSQPPDPPNDKIETQRLRILYADSLNWIRRNPEDYRIVWLQNWANHRFANLQELYVWLNDPAGPFITQFNAWATQSQARTAPLQAHWAARAAVHPPQPYHAWTPAVQMQGMGPFQRFMYRMTGIQSVEIQVALVIAIIALTIAVLIRAAVN